MTKRHVILDGSKINSKEDFHKQIAELLDFGPYYGENLDALWDVMTGGVELKVLLHWVNSEYSKKALGEDYYELILSIFNDVKEQTAMYSKEWFDYSLE